MSEGDDETSNKEKVEDKKISAPDDTENKNNIGATWPDLIMRIPLWLLSLAALSFMGVVIYSLFFSTDVVTLGFLGDFGRKNKPAKESSLPIGAVIASLKECQKSPGWETFKESTGRFLVGAGSDYAPNYNKWSLANGDGSFSYLPLTTYKLMDPGGEERHKISIMEMPQHDHTDGRNIYVYMMASDGYSVATAVKDAPGEPNLHSVGRIQPQGGNQPHNIIPPYLPLYFCKRY